MILNLQYSLQVTFSKGGLRKINPKSVDFLDSMGKLVSCAPPPPRSLVVHSPPQVVRLVFSGGARVFKHK